MNVDELALQWPYCYHVTFAANLRSIAASRAVFSAATLLARAGAATGCRRRRTSDTPIGVGRTTVVLRNQRALHPEALELPDDCAIGDDIALLNEKAFFWPGTARGPCADGLRLLAAHRRRRPAAIVRVETQALMQANGDLVHAATCNTGAAWLDGDERTRRAPDMFIPLRAFSDDPRAIIELSFVDSARLPKRSGFAALPHER